MTNPELTPEEQTAIRHLNQALLNAKAQALDAQRALDAAIAEFHGAVRFLATARGATGPVSISPDGSRLITD